MGTEFDSLATEAARREGIEHDFQTVALLGFAADAAILEPGQVEALRKGLRRQAVREPVIDGLPMEFSLDAIGLLGIALGTKALADPDNFSCGQVALRLAAVEWTSSAHLADQEELNFRGQSTPQSLSAGPDVHIFWRPFYTGGELWLRNEGTENAKNVRLQCSAENGWKPALRPEMIPSLSPGAIVRIVDESRFSPAPGQSIAEYVHSLSSKQLRMTVTFEDRSGEERARDFCVVATGRHVVTGSLAVTFYAGGLRIVTPAVATRRNDGPVIGISNRPPLGVSDNLPGFQHVPSIGEDIATKCWGMTRARSASQIVGRSTATRLRDQRKVARGGIR